MTDTAPATGTSDAETTTSEPATGGGGKPLAEMTVEEQLDYFKGRARTAEDRLRDKKDPDIRDLRRERDAVRKELDTLKQATMSETEKAVAAARAEGRTEALREAASKVVAAEFRAAAAGRIEITDDILDGVNLAAFVDEAGDVDLAKVGKFIDGIAPKTEDRPVGFPDLSQGARGNSADPKTMALNGDPLLRSVKDKLGIR